MKYTILFLAIGLILFFIPINNSRPTFNGNDPGCSGGGCHTFQDGLVQASVNGLDVQVTVVGASGVVAGELVDGSGTVVTYINSTNSNPFTLTATNPGNYIVNAGKSGPLRWDSASVNIVITGVSINSSNPTSFMLYNNYPNPFNPTTIIKYSIPEVSFTSLIIYNELGKEVSTLINETKSAGTYEVEFNASNLSSGVYYYKLQAGTFTETKKMILAK